MSRFSITFPLPVSIRIEPHQNPRLTRVQIVGPDQAVVEQPMDRLELLRLRHQVVAESRKLIAAIKAECDRQYEISR